MRQLIVFVGILALVLGTTGVAKVHAGTYGTDVTIYDQANYVAGRLTPSAENNETEPGTVTSQIWDLEAFQFNKVASGSNPANSLTMIAGYNFANPPTAYNNVTKKYEVIYPGALFLKTSLQAPAYGNGAQGVGGNAGTPDSYTPLLNSSLWNYTYAILFNFTDKTYKVYSALSTSVDIMYGGAGYPAGYPSNPYTIDPSTWTLTTYGDGKNFSLTQVTGTIDGLTGMDGNNVHYIVSGIDLSFLDAANGATPETWLHFTYACGNDNLMGQIPFTPVPVPPTALLLGTGLLGLVGLRRFRKS